MKPLTCETCSQPIEAEPGCLPRWCYRCARRFNEESARWRDDGTPGGRYPWLEWTEERAEEEE